MVTILDRVGVLTLTLAVDVRLPILTPGALNVASVMGFTCYMKLLRLPVQNTNARLGGTERTAVISYC
ncbi:hypothetical protein ABKN59_009880 [Abortiporus biennis]